MTSKERLLAAIDCKADIYPPCSFMLYKGLQINSQDYADFIERQLRLGLDAYVMIPPRPPTVVNDHYNLHGIPVNYSPKVAIKEWVEEIAGEEYPILIKEYHTPDGTLRAEVRKTTDWRWGDHIPFCDDYISPRSRKVLVASPDDLNALSHLLVPPTEAEINMVKEQSAPLLKLAEKRGLLITGGWGVGADMLGWIFGLENMVFAAFDQPDFLHGMLNMIAEWNHSRMDVLLNMGIDLYIKRGWYETCNFWSPKSFRKFIFPILKADVDRAHAVGVRFGYIVTSKTMPLLDQYIEAGVDVLIGVDPMQWDFQEAKRKLSGKICLWGGVNGQLTVEHGSEESVREEVRLALDVLSPEGGFILSPVDNVRTYDAESTQNVQALIDEWQVLSKE